MATKEDYLQQAEVLQDLNPVEIAQVINKTRLIHYNTGHLFYMPADPGEVLFIVKSGRVQLYRMSPDGRKLILAIMQPGSVFGHMALVGQRLQNTYAQAMDDCTICTWNRAEVEQLLLTNPQFALRLLEIVGRRLNHIEDRLADAAFKRMPARVAALLLLLNQENLDGCVLRGYTHQYLADMLGTYRETITQILNEFKQTNLIDLGRKKITIMDPGGLACIAEQES